MSTTAPTTHGSAIESAGLAVQGIARGCRARPLPLHRQFEPRLLGIAETAAWVAYYRRDWVGFARAGVTVARHSFRLSWPETIACSWLVLRANQLWAPYPDNAPERAQRAMEWFYTIVRRRSGEAFDPRIAAALEVRWWQVHRDRQHGIETEDTVALAIGRLYAHVYDLPLHRVYDAAEQRAIAMEHSDRWVEEGCDPASPRIERVREALIASYTSLLRAVGTPTAAARPTIPA
jgi:hypothetical protein